MKTQPIFIVGVQRSGTTLLAAMLAAHTRLSCGPETHFFRNLSHGDARRLCAAEEWPRPAADFIASIRPTGVQSGNNSTLVEQYQLDPVSVAAYLSGRERTIANMLASVTEQHMQARGKSRWVEKTPDHILHLKAIRQHFPDSPIIRIVRDPRDVALSLMKVPWGARSFLEGLLHWERLDRASRDFFAVDEFSMTLRFEDLVSQPAGELQKLCGFIGEEYEARMLDTSQGGVEVNGEQAPWKRKAREAADVNRIAAWRSALADSENRLAEAVIGDRIERFGYPRHAEFSRAASLFPGLHAAHEHAPALTAVAERGVRLWTARSDERPTARVYLGDPGTREWLGDGKAGRVVRTVSLLVDMARAGLSGGAVYWLPDPDAPKWRGVLTFVLRTVLKPHQTIATGEGSQGGQALSASSSATTAVERQNVG